MGQSSNVKKNAGFSQSHLLKNFDCYLSFEPFHYWNRQTEIWYLNVYLIEIDCESTYIILDFPFSNNKMCAQYLKILKEILTMTKNIIFIIH